MRFVEISKPLITQIISESLVAEAEGKNTHLEHLEDNIFNKVDVIMFGQETIGSAERSCDVKKMKEMFYTIEDGGYSNKLFELFGKDRVEKELEEFLSLNFFPRFGAGIGLTRLARAYEMNKKQKQSIYKELIEMSENE